MAIKIFTSLGLIIWSLIFQIQQNFSDSYPIIVALFYLLQDLNFLLLDLTRLSIIFHRTIGYVGDSSYSEKQSLFAKILISYEVFAVTEHVRTLLSLDSFIEVKFKKHGQIVKMSNLAYSFYIYDRSSKFLICN